MTFIKGSLKNWLMKGAERFMQKILLVSEACFATFRIDSGDTVRKNPWKQERHLLTSCWSSLTDRNWTKQVNLFSTTEQTALSLFWQETRANMNCSAGSYRLKHFKLLICGFWILTGKFEGDKLWYYWNNTGAKRKENTAETFIWNVS